MAKFDLPEGMFIDVRFCFTQAYDKVSEKGNVTVAPESGYAEVIGFGGLEAAAMKFGRYGAERGKVAFFVRPEAKAPAKAPAKAKAKAPAKAKAKAPAKAEAPDMEQMFQMFQAFMQQQK